MPDNYIVNTAIFLAALTSASMWIDYFRRIDVFEKERIADLLVALLIGCGTPFICDVVYVLIERTGFAMNGDLGNDFLYTVFAIGLNEELSKIVGVLIAFRILRKKINEPIDYLIYAGVVALGFSLVENIGYFKLYGIRIIVARTYMSALEHMINTTLIVYGYYRLQLFGRGEKTSNTLAALGVAILSHGFFDLFLMNDFLGPFTSVLNLVVYVVGINFWIQMLNNANNFSAGFDYAKTYHSGELQKRLFYWYLVITLVGIVAGTIEKGPEIIVYLLFGSKLTFILMIFVIIRVTRFKVFKEKYFVIRPELPFYITRNNDEDFNLFGSLPFKIRGENAFEYSLTTAIGKEVTIYPLSPKKTFISTPRKGVIVAKHLLHDDVVIYEYAMADNKNENLVYFLKPKTRGITRVNEKYPIAGLYRYTRQPGESFTYEDINYNKLASLEWTYIIT